MAMSLTLHPLLTGTRFNPQRSGYERHVLIAGGLFLFDQLPLKKFRGENALYFRGIIPPAAGVTLDDMLQESPVQVRSGARSGIKQDILKVLGYFVPEPYAEVVK